MKNLLNLFKPEYLLRPSQIFRRIKNNKIQIGFIYAELPWRKKIKVNPREDLGKSILHLGYYELALSELIWRSLTKNTEAFLDVGTNIGYFPLLALEKKEFQGKIHAFEPHPGLYQLAAENINLNKNSNRVEFHQIALSDSAGEARLFIPTDFKNNEGIASLEKPRDGNSQEIVVKTKSLDEVCGHLRNIVAKIDTEGHEAAVLRGARSLLGAGAFRCIFFEEFKSPNEAETFTILKEFGFKIARIKRTFWGPSFELPEKPVTHKIWEPINYIAAPVNSDIWNTLGGPGWSIIWEN